MAEQEQVAVRKGREGGRWINERPTPEEFAAWFRESVRVDEALNPDHYVGGVVLIPAVDERSKYVKGFTGDGKPIIDERPELIYTPHPRVQARIDYFWDLVNAHAEYRGVLEPVYSPRPDAGYYVTSEHRMVEDRIIERDHVEIRRGSPLDHLLAGLPPGFFIMSVPVGQNYTHFLACQYHCAIFEEGKEHPVREGWGTQQVAMLKGRREPYADPDLIAKAETSAKGRALGAAGILVLPGGGIASAEDMIETAVAPPAQQAPTEAQEAAEPTEGAGRPSQVRTGAQQVADERAELVARAQAVAKELRENHPEKFDEFGRWANSLKPPLQKLSDARGGRLRGVVTRLERMLDEAVSQARDTDATPESGSQPGENDGENGGVEPTESPVPEQGDTDETRQGELDAEATADAAAEEEPESA